MHRFQPQLLRFEKGQSIYNMWKRLCLSVIYYLQITELHLAACLAVIYVAGAKQVFWPHFKERKFIFIRSFIHSSGTGTMLGGGDTRISKIDRHNFSHSLQYSDNVLTSSTHPVNILSSG